MRGGGRYVFVFAQGGFVQQVIQIRLHGDAQNVLWTALLRVGDKPREQFSLHSETQHRTAPRTFMSPLKICPQNKLTFRTASETQQIKYGKRQY